jgi:hypothetical protein
MPQLDSLAFSSQIFWLFVILIFSYYLFLKICVIRVKFSLGFKRFLILGDKNNSFYKLSQSYIKEKNRNDLLFFFNSYNFSLNSSEAVYSNKHFISEVGEKVSNMPVIGIIAKPLEIIGGIFESKTNKEMNYVFILSFDNNFYQFNISNKEIELTDLINFSKDINYFYERFLNYFKLFFSLIKFYIYELLFTVFFYFLNFFKKLERTIQLYKLLKTKI